MSYINATDFKDLNQSNKIVNNSVKEFLKLPFGTIIFADRYSNDSEKALFKGSHMRGPYIVVGRTKKELICLKGTGSLPKSNVFWHNILVENNENSDFGLLKRTYFKISSLFFLDESRHISVSGHLDGEGIEMLTRKMLVTKFHKCYDKDVKAELLDIPELILDVGNIILRKQQLYFIFNITDNNVEAFRIFTNSVNENKVLMNSKYYYLDFDTQITFSKKAKNLGLYDLVSQKQAYLILQKMRKYFVDISKETKLTRGSVVQKQEDYYYIYGEEQNQFNAFKIIPQERENYHQIEIDKSTFYTVFNKEITIQKNEAANYPIILKATEAQMDLIKKSKKNYKKSQKQKNPSKKTVHNIPSIVPGAIVETDNLAKERYLVLERDKNVVTWISVDDFLNNKQRTETAAVEHLIRIGMLSQENLKDVISWLNNDNQDVDNTIKMKMKVL